jgi:hypothetical protein
LLIINTERKSKNGEGELEKLEKNEERPRRMAADDCAERKRLDECTCKNMKNKQEILRIDTILFV